MPTRRSWSRRALPLLLALLLTAAGGQAALGQELADIERIATETAALRELPPLTALDPVFLTKEEAVAAIEALVREEWDEAEVAAAVRSAAALGLLDADTDLLQLNIDLLGEQAGGYFDPETDQIVVIQDAEFGALGTYVLSHEITHALQDEHLGLGDLMDESEAASDDELLAAVSLYEGDATLASSFYIATKPVLALQLAGEAIAGGVAETTVIDAAPPIVSLGLLFPYLAGPSFVNELYEEGGWPAVDEAFADPPTSTEQILHIDKYFDGDEPVALTLPDPAATLGPGWTAIDDNTLGEFQTSLLLADLDPGQGINELMGTFTLPPAATTAAAGWDGDRYALWGNGEQEVLVWQSVWDSEEEAVAFSRALQADDEARFGGRYEGEIPEEVALVTDERAARIVRDGARVGYALAPTLELADAATVAMRET